MNNIKIHPPTFAIRFLRAICPDHLYEEIEGDLIQKFDRDVKAFGERKAKRRFVWNVIRFFRPGIVLRNNFSYQLLNTIMLRNYFKVSLRNIQLNPLYAIINMLSLAIGLSSCLVIYLFISDEKSFDTFHSKQSLIYRIYEMPHFSGTVQKVALTMGGMGPAMASDYPEVKSFTRYWNKGKAVFKTGEDQFLVDNVAAVDSTFLDIFDFELIAGDRTTALDEPNTIIVTAETAAKFFKNLDDAIGSTFSILDTDYRITGVLKNIPEHSHLQFDALQSISTFVRKDPRFNSNWDGNFLNTYLLLHPDTQIKSLESKFKDFLIRHTGVTDITKSYTLFLQSLEDVHLRSTDIEHDYNNYRKFNGVYLDVFAVIGVFILVIACVNFMNLTTARASQRWKEIGVRKSVGAKKAQLFGQFIFESTLLALMALAFAALIDLLFMPFLNQLIGRQLLLSSFLAHPLQIVMVVVITLALGLLTGIYPSFYMTSFNMSAVLKGGTTTRGKSVFRSSMIILQFGLALVMIESTLVVVEQLSFMKNTDVGFNKDQIMLVPMNIEVNQKMNVLKTEWLRNEFITGVTASGQRLGNSFNAWGFKVKSDTGILHLSPSNVNVDYDYLKVYGIKLKSGRDFSKDFLTDQGRAFIINETMARDLNLKEPLGTPAGHAWYEDDSLGTIIGVAKDFNFNSLHNKINALALVCHPEWGYDEISVKIDGDHAQEAIASIKAIWEKNISSYPFSYSFLNEHFDNLYRSDQQMSSVVTVMASLAILISCMGLFGLAAITTQRKIKEIGIRKSLGATEIQITTMLSKHFTRLIVVSFILVSPIAYYFLAAWLESFAYRITINPLLFLLGGFLALIIALLTISYHTIKSARQSPIKYLRQE